MSTVLLNLMGLPGMSIRFEISHDGMLISVQVMLIWQAEQTVHAASLLEAVSSVRDLHPVI